MTTKLITIALSAAILTSISPAFCLGQNKEDGEKLYKLLASQNKQFPIGFMKVLESIEVKSELGLTADQLEQLASISREVENVRTGAGMVPFEINMDDSSTWNNAVEVNDIRNMAIASANELAWTKTRKVLSAKQLNRYDEILLQKLLSEGPNDPFGFYRSGKLREATEISKSDLSELRRSTKSAEEEYLDELRQLQLKYHRKIRSSASVSVQKELERAFGDPFIPKSPKSVLDK